MTVEGGRKPVPKREVLLDRCFFSYEKLRLLKDDSFNNAASLVSRKIKNVLSSAARSVDMTDNVMMY